MNTNTTSVNPEDTSAELWMEDILELQQWLKQREQELSEREERLNEKVNWLDEREEKLLMLQKELIEEQKKLRDQQDALDSLNEKLTDKDERQRNRDEFLQDWKKRLEAQEVQLEQHNDQLHAHQKTLEQWQKELEEFEAKKYSENLRGLKVFDFSIDELQDLMLTIEEASKRVHEALERREAEEAVAKAKNDYCCPIGLHLIKDPVVAADGHTYERVKIQAWFASCQLAGSTFKSPKTNLELDHLMLIPNHALKSVIQDAVDNTVASMRSRERAVPPPAEVDDSIGVVRSC